MTKQKQYSIPISKNNPNIDLEDLNLWIDTLIKNKWSKKESKHKVIYTFNDAGDAFKFKMRWSFG